MSGHTRTSLLSSTIGRLLWGGHTYTSLLLDSIGHPPWAFSQTQVNSAIGVAFKINFLWLRKTMSTCVYPIDVSFRNVDTLFEYRIPWQMVFDLCSYCKTQLHWVRSQDRGILQVHLWEDVMFTCEWAKWQLNCYSPVVYLTLPLYSTAERGSCDSLSNMALKAWEPNGTLA